MRQFGHNVSRIKRVATQITLSGIVLSASIAGASSATSSISANASALYFSSTGHSVGGSFLKFYNANGGVRVFGLPLTEELNEGGMTVQYFERQRFEYHPEKAGTQFEVQLSLLGQQAARGKPALSPVAPFNSNPNLAYIPQTGHSISGVFLDYWQNNGGLKVIGYPVSEPTTENGLIVQYFERARMEYHPEKVALGFPVELSLLGRDYMQTHAVSNKAGGEGRVAEPQTDRGEAQASYSHSSNGMEQDMLNRINGARQAAGLPPVAADSTVASLSGHRSADMASKNYFSHQAPAGDDYMALLKGAGVSYKWTGEIIAWNSYPQDQTVGLAFDGFIHSPRHYEIIMDPRYNYAGVGAVKDKAGRYFYTVIFVQR